MTMMNWKLRKKDMQGNTQDESNIHTYLSGNREQNN